MGRMVRVVPSRRSGLGLEVSLGELENKGTRACSRPSPRWREQGGTGGVPFPMCGARSFAAGEGGPRQTLRGKPERLRGVDRAGGVAASGHERSEGAWHAEGCLV